MCVKFNTVWYRLRDFGCKRYIRTSLPRALPYFTTGNIGRVDGVLLTNTYSLVHLSDFLSVQQCHMTHMVHSAQIHLRFLALSCRSFCLNVVIIFNYRSLFLSKINMNYEASGYEIDITIQQLLLSLT